MYIYIYIITTCIYSHHFVSIYIYFSRLYTFSPSSGPLRCAYSSFVKGLGLPVSA